MSVKLRTGSNCAACVVYADTDAESWILTKVERKMSGNRFVVRDEFADDAKYETYVVDSNHITPYTASNSEDFKVGEKVLALWRDEETNEWSTMFYSAKVLDVDASDTRHVTLLYGGTEFGVEVEKSKIARLPANFSQSEDNESSEEDQANTKNQNQNQNETTGDEATAEDNNSESATDDQRDKQKSQQETANKQSSNQNSEDEEAKDGKTHKKIEQNDDEGKNENHSPQKNQPLKDDSANANNSTTQQSPQPPNTQEKLEKIDKTDHKAVKPSKTHEDSQKSKVPDNPEERRIFFMFNKPEVAERPKLEYLTNDDFTRLAGPKQEIVRMHTEEGTPLLDSLEDPELFNQENLLHVTGSGAITISNLDDSNAKSGIVSGSVQCGRLSKIINEW